MITVYLKATNFCNVDCTHCYLTEEVRADKTKMTDETLHKVAHLLKDMKKAQRANNVHIIWHGGEPLVLGAQYYTHAEHILDDVLGEYTESLQTSLVALRDDHIPWIKNRLRNFVGSSMDFTARTTKEGPEGYQKLWMQKVEKCREHGIEVIPGVTPSLPEIKNAAQIVKWMEDRGFIRFNIERYNSFGFKAPMHPSNQEHANFLWDLYVAVVINRVAEGKPAPILRVLAAAIGGVLYGNPGDRWGGSCQREFVVIEPNGDLNNCPDKSSKEPAYSNVIDGFEGFAQSPMRRRWIRLQAVGHRNDHCATCENSSWCKSGCPITCNDLSKEQECSGYKSFITKVRESMKNSHLEQAAKKYFTDCQNNNRVIQIDGYGE